MRQNASFLELRRHLVSSIIFVPKALASMIYENKTTKQAPYIPCGFDVIHNSMLQTPRAIYLGWGNFFTTHSGQR